MLLYINYAIITDSHTGHCWCMAHQYQTQLSLYHVNSHHGLMVMIEPCQGLDRGSIPLGDNVLISGYTEYIYAFWYYTSVTHY